MDKKVHLNISITILIKLHEMPKGSPTGQYIDLTRELTLTNKILQEEHDEHLVLIERLIQEKLTFKKKCEQFQYTLEKIGSFNGTVESEIARAALLIGKLK